MWALLIVTLPTQPNAVRLRIWRSLKSLGCAALRDGAYLLPAEQVAQLDALAEEVREHDGSASVLALAPRDAAQRDEILALFDRRDAYAEWRGGANQVQLELDKLGETDARRRLRGVADALQALRRIDYYPGAAADQAERDLLALRHELDARFSRGEPLARADTGIERLDRARFQGKRWATRARPWVDRLACAWLIRRFIDPAAEFIWLPEAAQPARAPRGDSRLNAPRGDSRLSAPRSDSRLNAPRGDSRLNAPRGALGFDYDGARFSHVGARVTFEVLAASFGLDADPRLQRIAGAVHYLDVGGIPVPEAAGLESVLGGLRALHADDDRMFAAASAVFDALYASPGGAA